MEMARKMTILQVHIPRSHSIAMYLTAWFTSWCWNVIAYEEAHVDHFWAGFGIHIFTWMMLEKAYKQSKFEQEQLAELERRGEQNEQV